METLCAAFGHGDDHAGVLLRQKALRHDDIEQDRAAERRDRDQQDERPAARSAQPSVRR